MYSVEIKAYAKINLSLDVLGKLKNGYHEVEMIMQGIDLFDNVIVRWFNNNKFKDIKVHLSSNKFYLPTDNRNIAYKAACLMAEKYGRGKKGVIRIDILKQIPVGAGLAGGSSNAAAVILAINKLWKLRLEFGELLELGGKIGSDVPFSIIEAIVPNRLYKSISGCPHITPTVLAKGQGFDMEMISPLDSWILMVKPPFSVSTKEVYGNLDFKQFRATPDNKSLILALKSKSPINDFCENVLETYTLNAYPRVARLKEEMRNLLPGKKVQMSGSGPTVFSILYDDKEAGLFAKEILKERYKDVYLIRTLC